MQNFIIGIIFACAILPILDSFVSLVLSFFEMIKSYINLKIVSNNQKLNELPKEDCKAMIGF